MNTFFDVLDTIIQVIGDFVEALIHKKNEAKDTIAIKAKLSTCKDLENRSYMAIGKKYYEMYKDGGADPVFEKAMKEIKNSKKAIDDLNEQLDVIKRQ